MADEQTLGQAEWIVNARKAEDADGRTVALIKGEWAMNYLKEKNPNIEFQDTPY